MTKNPTPKILMVEDDMIIAADISMQLTKLGYEVSGINTRAEDALKTLETTRPDIILMDIMLSGDMNGIDAAKIILAEFQIPVIFLTSNSDDATFKEALTAKPYAFISKPFQKEDLERGIKITLQRIEADKAEAAEESNDSDHYSTMNDRMFIRHKNQLIKVGFDEILFAEADRNYCKIYTSERDYLISVPLGSIETQFPPKSFMRVHRSFVVNLKKIDALNENHEYLVISKHTVPVSRRLREDVVQRLKIV